LGHGNSAPSGVGLLQEKVGAIRDQTGWAVEEAGVVLSGVAEAGAGAGGTGSSGAEVFTTWRAPSTTP
jgi:hypothetical protein